MFVRDGYLLDGCKDDSLSVAINFSFSLSKDVHSADFFALRNTTRAICRSNFSVHL